MRAFLLTPLSGRAWRELAYLLATVPLALVGFALTVAVLVPALPLGLLGLGLLLAAGLLHLLGWYGGLYRGAARHLLGRPVPAPPPFVAPVPGFFGWLSASLRNAAGWRAAAFAVLRLPLTIVMLYVGVGVWAYGVVAVAYPVISYVDSGNDWNALAIGSFTFDTLPRKLVVAAAGLTLLLLAPWVVRGLISADLFLIRRLLAADGNHQRVRDLEQSRALAVDDAAATLRRIERDLHDGAQATLVALAMDLTMMRDHLRDPEPDLATTRSMAETAHGHAKDAIGELRDLARGIHPPVLDRGLVEAVQSLAARSPLPVRVDATVPHRPARAIETIAYFCVSELLTNAVRHSGARSATVDLTGSAQSLRLTVGDDGRGGADPNLGTGLAGLIDRVRTVDGSLRLASPPGGPTTVVVDLPLST